jgi:cobalt ABC transporter, permease protein CbiQ
VNPADLRLRIVSAVFLVLASSQFQHLSSVLFGLCFATILTFAARPDPAHWRRLMHVEGVVGLVLITMPFTMPGTPLFEIGPLTASREGVLRALLVSGKISTAVLIVLALLGTVDPFRMGAALHALRLPEPIVRLMVLTLRYLSLVQNETHRLLDAMRMRGFRARSNRHTWRSYGNLIGVLLVRALDRAHRIEEAMRCRGFAGHFPYAHQNAPSRRDWVIFAMLLVLSMIGTLWDRL